MYSSECYKLKPFYCILRLGAYIFRGLDIKVRHAFQHPDFFSLMSVQTCGCEPTTIFIHGSHLE